MKKLIYVLVGLALLIPAMALACPPQPKVTLCHSTMSPSNPFVTITVAADAVFKQGHDQHHDKADIIPPFDYYGEEDVTQFRYKYWLFGWSWTSWQDGECSGQYQCQERTVKRDVLLSYPGLNMSTIYGAGFTGAQVLANGCEVPEPPYEVCTEQTEWILVDTEVVEKPNGFTVTKYFYEKLDARDQETVCDTMVAVDREYNPLPPDVVLLNDCEGYDVIYIPDSRKPDQGYSIFSGKWTGPKDVLEKVDFPGDEELKLEGFTILEPPECYECISKTVFYWSDGLCLIRQREGPIGGQTRPFLPMQNMYCGCGYAHEDGWEGLFADSCSGDGSEYQYWNELPQFCGAQSCE